MSSLHRKRILDKRMRRQRTQRRIRNRLRGSAARPRLAVYKSLRYIYAQIIDDQSGNTLAQASSREKGLIKAGAGACNRDAARTVGETLAERAKEKGIDTVVFDRAGFLYHGKIQALADGARDKGLKF